jgi:hypothetical protein
VATLKLKRGTTNQINQYTGDQGEVIFNTETGRIHVMDGTSLGGKDIGKDPNTIDYEVSEEVQAGDLLALNDDGTVSKVGVKVNTEGDYIGPKLSLLADTESQSYFTNAHVLNVDYSPQFDVYCAIIKISSSTLNVRIFSLSENYDSVTIHYQENISYVSTGRADLKLVTSNYDEKFVVAYSSNALKIITLNHNTDGSWTRSTLTTVDSTESARFPKIVNLPTNAIRDFAIYYYRNWSSTECTSYPCGFMNRNTCTSCNTGYYYYYSNKQLDISSTGSVSGPSPFNDLAWSTSGNQYDYGANILQKDPNSNTMIFLLNLSAVSNRIYLIDYTYGANTYNLKEQQIHSPANYCVYPTFAVDWVNKVGVFIFVDSNSSDALRYDNIIRPFSFTSSSLTLGTSYFLSNTDCIGVPQITFDKRSGRFLAFYAPYENNGRQGAVPQTHSICSSFTTDGSTVQDVVQFGDNDNERKFGCNIGHTITKSLLENGEHTGYIPLVYDQKNDAGSSTGDLTVQVVKLGITTSTSNADKIIGVAKQSKLPGGSIEVAVTGITGTLKATNEETDDNEELVVGQEVYIKENGKLTHNPTVFGKVGRMQKFGFINWYRNS